MATNVMVVRSSSAAKNRTPTMSAKRAARKINRNMAMLP